MICFLLTNLLLNTLVIQFTLDLTEQFIDVICRNNFII